MDFFEGDILRKVTQLTKYKYYDKYSLDRIFKGEELKTLKEVVEAQGLSNLAFTQRAGISLRAIADIRSGKMDETIRNKDNIQHSTKQRIGLIQTVARALVACGKNPQEWLKDLGLSLDSREEHAVLVATKNQSKPLVASVTGSEEWSRLLLVGNDALTKEDAEQLLEAQKLLGDFLTVKLAIELLISRHHKITEKEQQ